MVNIFGGSGNGKRGPSGPPGPSGPVGKQGRKGDQGLRGDPGEKGESGVKGDKGTVGKDGKQGEVGPRGDTGSKGQSGARGLTGGLSLVFYPKTIIESLWKNMALSYYFKTEKSGVIIVDDKATAIKNQIDPNSYKAIADHQVGHLNRYHDVDQYYLNFKKQVYGIKGEFDRVLAITPPTKSIIMLNFKISKWPSKIQYIFSSGQDWRQLYLKGQTLVFRCDDVKVALPIYINDWNVVFIELNNRPNEDSIYQVNEGVKTFKSFGVKASEDTLYLGGKDSTGDYFEGAIGRFELFGHIFDIEDKHHEDLDPKIKQIYLDNFYNNLS